MTLNGQYALLQKRCVLRSPPEKDLNEDRPIVSVAKCRPMTLVSGNIRYMHSRMLLGDGASNDSGVVNDGDFHRFYWLLVRKS